MQSRQMFRMFRAALTSPSTCYINLFKENDAQVITVNETQTETKTETKKNGGNRWNLTHIFVTDALQTATYY